MGINLAHSGRVLAAYRVLACVGHRLPAPSALRRTLVARRGAADRWLTWARDARGDGPIVWAHAASVGEQHVLEPVLHRLHRARPALRIVLTHTSPSVVPTPQPAGVCHRDFLPWDEPGSMAKVLDALHPGLLLFGRGDLWPGLVSAAAARGIPVAVAGATVRPHSARLHAVARRVLRRVYRAVSWVGAVTPGDADRWIRLGVPPERVAVTGDPRHERTLERVADLAVGNRVRAWAGAAPVLVAGSTEPDDDGVLAATLARLAADLPALRTLIVPHEATQPRTTRILRELARHGVPAGTWRGAVDEPIPEAVVVVVAAKGLLADLYLGADIAYVGGGFRQGRLHAVAEPAAVGLPVIAGPRWHGAADAEPMLAAGGLLVIADDGVGLADAVLRLLRDPGQRARRGLAARSVLTTGAAHATAEAALELLGIRTS
jgi:3-deoxy-D-manno-octulosonic-acid transferase